MGTLIILRTILRRRWFNDDDCEHFIDELLLW